VRNATRATAAYGSAAVVSAVAAGLQATAIQRGAAAAAMLALTLCTAFTSRTAPRLRRVLLAFCLFLTACALVKLVARLTPYPGPPTVAGNGCPIETDEIVSYWRLQLRYGQLAEALRLLALTCAVWAVKRLPRPAAPYSWREHSFTTLLPIPVVLYGLAPLKGSPDVWSLLPVTAPAILSLVAGACLTVLTTARSSGRRVENAVLGVGAVLLMFSTADAVDALIVASWQIPPPESELTKALMLCSTVELPGPSSPQVAATVARALLVLAAPAMLVWSALQTRAAENPAPETGTE